jgi:hypothetical protein
MIALPLSGSLLGMAAILTIIAMLVFRKRLAVEFG